MHVWNRIRKSPGNARSARLTARVSEARKKDVEESAITRTAAVLPYWKRSVASASDTLSGTGGGDREGMRLFHSRSAWREAIRFRNSSSTKNLRTKKNMRTRGRFPRQGP